MGAIFDHEPQNWSQLQDLVAQMFSEIGCEVRVSDRVKLVRGEKEIDVLVRDHHTTPRSVYLCEMTQPQRVMAIGGIVILMTALAAWVIFVWPAYWD